MSIRNNQLRLLGEYDIALVNTHLQFHCSVNNNRRRLITDYILWVAEDSDETERQ